jgi:hypothetical protein
MMKAGYEKSYILKRLRDDLKARKELIDVVHRLAKDFSSLQIVIRPHPFEEEKEYLEVFRDMRNISIRREGTIAPWLKSALCVLHLNSSIALDAYMLGQIPISIDWINTDIIRGMSEVSYEISRKSKSYDELKDMISHSVTRNEQNKVTNVVDTEIEQQITDWFHQIDGKASLRVAEAILKTIQKERHRSDKSQCKKMALYGSNNAASFKGWGYGLTRIALGPVLSELLRSLFFDRLAGAGVRHNKAIRVSKVNELLERIDHIVADDQVYTANCHNGRGNLADKIGMLSLRIQPQEISY